MKYSEPYILSGMRGNNAFSYIERRQIQKKDPEIIIPGLKRGSLDDVRMGKMVVFEEIEDGKLKSCIGLENFIRLTDSQIPITIFDNHNHALYFWIEAIHEGFIKPGFELIHIDEHSDLWSNEYIFDQEKAIGNQEYAWEFTNFSCNVGNYIEPARNSGTVGKIIRIENDFQVVKYMDYVPSDNSVLNIDLDFFAPEMDFIDEKKKIALIRNLISKVGCITIATSPFFIDQKRAIEALHKIILS